MENINLSIPSDRHTIISPMIPTPSSTIIGISPPSASATANISHRHRSTVIPGLGYILLLYHQHHNPSAILLSTVITFSPADPSSINCSNTCPKTVSTHASQFQSIKSLMLQNSLQ